MAIAYPPAPSDRPANPAARTDRWKVIAICRAVENLSPIGDAMRAQGIHENFGDWEGYAREGTEPFWSWAVSCLMMAEGEAVVEVSGKLRERINDGDTKAMQFFLSRRSKAYQDKKEVEVVHSGGTTNTVLVGRLDQLLLSGEMSVADLITKQRALEVAENPDIIEAEIVTEEPHPMFLIKKTGRGED